MNEDLERITKWDTTDNFSRDLIIAILWGEQEWYESMAIALVRVDQAIEFDLVKSNSSSAARLSLAYEDFGQLFFTCIDNHLASDQAYTQKIRQLESHSETIRAKKAKVMQEIQELNSLRQELRDAIKSEAASDGDGARQRDPEAD